MDKVLAEIFRLIPALPGYILTGLQALYYGTKLLRTWLRRRRPPLPREKIERRLRLREEFSTRMGEPSRYGTYGEAIIRDIERLDAYPNVDPPRWGISPWFKAEVNDLYHRGVEVIVFGARDAVPESETRGWRFLREGEEVEYKVLAYPVGRIPYDFVEKVDWEGDEYYRIPHIYCRFDGPYGEPYEEVVFKGKLYETTERLILMEGLRRELEKWSWLRLQTYLMIRFLKRHRAVLFLKRHLQKREG